MMMLDNEDQGELNLLVVQYLGQIDTKLRDRFCKAANIQPGQSSSLTLEGVVQSYLESKNKPTSNLLKRSEETLCSAQIYNHGEFSLPWIIPVHTIWQMKGPAITEPRRLEEGLQYNRE